MTSVPGSSSSPRTLGLSSLLVLTGHTFPAPPPPPPLVPPPASPTVRPPVPPPALLAEVMAAKLSSASTSPFTLSASAILSRAGSSSSCTDTSPWYM